MTKNEILEYFKDINHAYNDCTRYDTLKRMLDELQEPCTDAISRQAVLDLPRIKTHNQWGNVIKESVDVEDVRQLPPVTPQYTEAEIQKMQDLESVEIQTAYEIGKAEGSEVLDKIRAEIMDINVVRDEYSQRQNDYCDGVEFVKRYVLQIIDKYKASPTGEEVEE